ncbi:MAG: hypothetical protein E6R04_09995 [Spirochaetes bacterium]|jgi:hypothetical protein|nr:MAG: hypothetical protein E6R04_09995 [Spirochaetota bacterium]
MPEKILGTVVFNKDFDIYKQGDTVQITKAMYSPFGEMYFKISGTICWVSTKEVTNIDVVAARRCQYINIYKDAA